MAAFDRIGEFDPTQTYALDTTGTLGSPELAGAVRFRVHPSGVKYGLQGYRLMLNESGGALTAGLVYAIAGADVATLGSSVKAAGGTATAAGFIAGVAQTALADDRWGWFQVYGNTSVSLITASGASNTADKAILETAASGTVDDTSGTGLKIGFAVGATTGNTQAQPAFLTLVSPRF